MSSPLKPFNTIHRAMVGDDVLKIMLTNVQPVATNSIKTDITEIAAGGGYTAGGNAITLIASSNFDLSMDDEVFTATAGGFAQFQYAVLYNSTSSTGMLICWWEAESPIDLVEDSTFTVHGTPSGMFYSSVEAT